MFERSYKKMAEHKIVNDFISNPQAFVAEESKNTIEKLIQILDHEYHNGEELVSDNLYDQLINQYETRFKATKTNVGAQVERDKVKIPVYMGSIDKLKSEREIQKWINNEGGYYISEKLDGISMLLDLSNPSEPKAYTRGNGVVGQDISWIIEKIFNLDELKLKPCYVRGELIISKKSWSKLLGKGARSYVAGLVNRKDTTDTQSYANLDFIAYEYFDLSNLNDYTDYEIQMTQIESLGLKPVYTQYFTSINHEDLKTTLETYKSLANYEIDGIVIVKGGDHKRTKNKNPSYIKAFKMNTGSDFSKVVSVQWNISKSGILKPVVNIEPVDLHETTIKKVTGNNARFLIDNNIGGQIGPGAMIEVVRSGDVIPKIVRVLVQGESPFPTDINYKWNENHVEIMIVNESPSEISNEQKVKQIEHFVNTIGIEFFKEATIRKAVDGGYDTIPKILRMTSEDFLNLPGIGSSMANKIYNSIQDKYSSASQVALMASAPSMSGFNIKKLSCVMDAIPDILICKRQEKELYDLLISIKGIADKTARLMISNIHDLIKFINELPEKKQAENKIEPPYVIEVKQLDDKKKGESLQGLNIVFSGFRDSQLQNQIVQKGGNVKTSVSGKTNILVVSSKNNITGKVQGAIDKGVTLMTKEEFIDCYF